MNQTKEQTVKQILDIISKAEVKLDELVPVLSLLLLSIGATLDGCDTVVSEEVLLNYANKPTLGNALMAQAMFLDETWKV